MKITLKPIRRKAAIDDSSEHLFSFLWPDVEKEKARRLIQRGKSLRLRFSYAYILRKGAQMFVRKQNQILNDAEAGTLHAKKRKISN